MSHEIAIKRIIGLCKHGNRTDAAFDKSFTFVKLKGEKLRLISIGHAST